MEKARETSAASDKCSCLQHPSYDWLMTNKDINKSMAHPEEISHFMRFSEFATSSKSWLMIYVIVFVLEKMLIRCRRNNVEIELKLSFFWLCFRYQARLKTLEILLTETLLTNRVSQIRPWESVLDILKQECSKLSLVKAIYNPS